MSHRTGTKDCDLHVEFVIHSCIGFLTDSYTKVRDSFMCHVTFMKSGMSDTHMNESCHTYEWVMSHI